MHIRQYRNSEPLVIDLVNAVVQFVRHSLQHHAKLQLLAHIGSPLPELFQLATLNGCRCDMLGNALRNVDILQQRCQAQPLVPAASEHHAALRRSELRVCQGSRIDQLQVALRSAALLLHGQPLCFDFLATCANQGRLAIQLNALLFDHLMLCQQSGILLLERSQPGLDGGDRRVLRGWRRRSDHWRPKRRDRWRSVLGGVSSRG